MGIILSTLRKIFNRKPAQSLSADELHTLENGLPEELTCVTTAINEPNSTTAAATPSLILADHSASELAIESFSTTDVVLSEFVPAQKRSLAIDDIGVTAQTFDTPAPELDQIPSRCSTIPPHSEPTIEPTQSEDVNQVVGCNARSDTTCSASEKAVTSVIVDGTPSAPPQAHRRRMPSTLWGQAVEEVRKENPEQLEEKKDADFNLATSLIDYVTDQRTKIDKSRFYYTNSKKEKVYYAEVFLTQLGRYATIGDLAIQHHPDVVALAWSGFRLLLDLGLAYYKRMALISSSLGYLGWVMRCCEIYEALYGEAEYSSITDLKKTLVDQYVSILRYLIYAKIHVNKSIKGQFAESLSTHLARLLNEVRECETRTRECADIAERQATRSKGDALRDEQKAHLDECRKQSGAIESALDDCRMRLKVICDYLDDLKWRETLNWISKIEYGAFHNTHQERRTPGTCEWLERNETFAEWRNGRSASSVFWLCGDAGTGKSHLTSKVIDDFQTLTNQYSVHANRDNPDSIITESHDNEDPVDNNSAMAFFYCSRDLAELSSPVSVLRAIVRQLCVAYSSGIPTSLVKLYERRPLNSGGFLTRKECKDYIIKFCEDFSDGVFIIIDALDELDQGARMEFFNDLEEILAGGDNVRIFLSSRNESDIKSKMSRYCRHYIRPDDNSEDIRLYMDTKIKYIYANSGDMRDYLESQRSKITALNNDTNGMFLAVSLPLEELSRQTTEDGIDDALSYNPRSLDEKYIDILSRIHKHGPTNRQTALNVIHWLYNTVDDRTPGSVLGSLQVSTDPGKGSKTPRRRINIDDIQAICCGLVATDKTAGILRFPHATVKEFLDKCSNYSKDEGRRWIAEICREVLTNPIYGAYRDDSSELDGPAHHNDLALPEALIEYASRNWGHHLSTLISRHNLEPAKWNGLLDSQSTAYKSWAARLPATLPCLSVIGGGSISLVWTACYYRLSPTFRECLKNPGDLPENDPNSSNHAGRTPLHHSAERGYTDYVQLLLDNSKIDVNCRDNLMNTPLMLAAQSNQPSIVSCLVDRETVDINANDNDGRTALMHACLNNDLDTVRLLLRTTRCDLELSDKDGNTALHHAISPGKEAVLRQLLGCSSADIINHQNQTGDTVLSLAAKRRYAGIVEIVLSTDVDISPNLPNRSGHTPLITAVTLGHYDVLSILIGNDKVDVNYPYKGETVLRWAAERNAHRAVELLLTRKDLRVADYVDSFFRRTPLMNAVLCSHLETLKCLVHDERVDVNAKDYLGDTALSEAAGRGNTSVVRILLESERIDVTIPGWAGQTPLEHAARKGYVEICEMLVARYDKGMQLPVNRRGKTALSAAIYGGSAQIVRLIMNTLTLDIHSKDDWGDTPLMQALNYGSTEIVEMFLKEEGVQLVDIAGDPLITAPALRYAARGGHVELWDMLLARCDQGMQLPADEDGVTVLSAAIVGGSAHIVRSIMKTFTFDINQRDNQGNSPLIEAACHGHTEIVEMFLSEEGIDTTSDQQILATALQYAARGGNVELWDLLLARCDQGMQLPADEDGVTVLSAAIVGGSAHIVRSIMKTFTFDINQRDNQGNSPLMKAACHGRTEISGILLAEENIEVDISNSHGTTALLMAAEYGYTEIFEMLISHYDNADWVREVDGDGCMPLLLASDAGDSRIVQLVLEAGGYDINYKDKRWGMSALAYASRRGCDEVVKMLLKEVGIDVNIVNLEGKSAYDLARESGHEHVIALLAPLSDHRA